MENFDAQILDIIGGTLGSNHLANVGQSALDDYLTISARTVLDVLPDPMLLKHLSTANTSSQVYAISNKRILRVTMAGYNCREVPFGLSAQVGDSNSIHYATAKSPVFFINGSSQVQVKPTTAEAAVDYMSYPTIDADGAGAISNFPDAAEYAVVLGAAIKVLQNVLSNHIHVDEDAELAAAMQLELASLQGIYQQEMSKLTGVKS